MEKHEAQEFIIQQLELGHGKNQIVEDLSQQLGAPSELVQRFVDRTIKTHTSTQVDIESKIDQVNSRDKEENISQTYSDVSTPDFVNNQNTIENGGVQIEPFDEESKHQTEINQEEAKNLIDHEELEGFVLQSVKKHHRYNDIVQRVCEKTGWSWNEAQLYVGRTQTKNHKVLTKSNRIFMIPFSGVFIVGGLLLMFWSVITIFDYYNGATSLGTSTLPIDFLVLVIAGFFTSFGIIAGGIFGLVRTLANQ